MVRELFEVRPDYHRLPLRDYFDEVYSDWRAKKRPASWVQEQRVWTRINEVLGSVRLEDIDAHVVADYLDSLVALSGPRKGLAASGTTRRLHRAAIQALLKRAFRLKHIKAMPNLAVFQIDGASKRVIEKPDPLDLAELEKLMDASAPKHRAMWAVAAGQGLRPTELNRIRWEDVDLEAKLLFVRGTKTAKSKAVVPMTPLAHRELRLWWVGSGQPAEGLAFPSRGGREYGSQGWRKSLKEAAARAGIERRVYPYLLRDSFATIAWLQGIPKEMAKQVMRHTVDSQMFDEVYCRPRPADVAERMKAFDFVGDK
ncbi:MAG: site-specific integrase [Proteobacteria bacterium]|nr:site-specific integrase [Pseudomonadota bacterium]